MVDSKPTPKPEQKPPAAPRVEEKAPAKAEPKAAAKTALLPAGSSTNPVVHGLLAELQTAKQNANGEAEQDVLKRLADLGYAAE